MAPFTAPNVLTPSMHVVFLLTCPQWNDHLRHQTKEEKGEEAQCVKGGGGQKNLFFRENQRFVLVNWVKLLNVQPWGPRLSDGEQNYGQKTAIFGHI